MDGNGCISRSSILALLLRSSVYALITHRTHCSTVHYIFLKTQTTSNKMVFRQKSHLLLSFSYPFICFDLNSTIYFNGLKTGTKWTSTHQDPASPI